MYQGIGSSFCGFLQSGTNDGRMIARGGSGAAEACSLKELIHSMCSLKFEPFSCAENGLGDSRKPEFSICRVVFSTMVIASAMEHSKATRRLEMPRDARIATRCIQARRAADYGGYDLALVRDSPSYRQPLPASIAWYGRAMNVPTGSYPRPEMRS